MLPDAFVCWRWRQPGYRHAFPVAAVNVLFRAIRRHYPHPFRAVVLTDDPAGLDPGIDAVALPTCFADMPSPHGRHAPACYRRLWAFSRAAVALGRRIVSLDLDVVVCGPLEPMLERAEPFVGWQDPVYPAQMNGSAWMLTTGAHPEVFDRFSSAGIAAARAAGYRGSDQAWLSYCLPNAPRWTRSDGIYSVRGIGDRPPDDARLVVMHGAVKPWDPAAPPWVREHYS